MKQLTGLDATFLYMETPSQFGHVAGLSIFERPDDADYEPFDAWRARSSAQRRPARAVAPPPREVPLRPRPPVLDRGPRLRPRLPRAPHAVPPPGDDEQLGELVARIVGRPLDRSRPLWETYVIEGLRGDASPSSPRSTTPPSTARRGPSCSR